jgi:spore coat polysaccharide biosynthesis protein SpsF
MRIVTIVQARMRSSRLPGKVMLDLNGMTVLARVVQRLKRTELTGDIVVATTRHPSDDVIVNECARIGVDVFRGDEDDVLDRYYCAAQAFKADAIVRITSDCPLIEPEITGKTIQAFLDEKPDYASNTLHRTYPRGLDTEVVTLEALKEVWKMARKAYQRSHVTAFIYENPELFKLLSIRACEDYGRQRWTLDTPEDLEFMRAIYEQLAHSEKFGWRETLALLERKPELLDLNSHVAQKALQEG